ncbi:hypothetical protein [Streptomyces sp. PSAA01]|uniref:hypothetical protein n=1 Tax=Streptomyces sp. PSAA01 TaxID=2912762 RepID=UPI001F15C7A0|nr:hypothetical protein [Streptomyces sp. PSAA01]MCG0287596.1 hypothetical protein [Streptomyces sp. PSAA01]
MVTFAQAQERAELWINGDVPAYQQREARVREFDLGFVVWAEDRADGPVSGRGAEGTRMVIARDSGETTLWPGLPVGEVIRRYEERYGTTDGSRDESTTGRQQRIDLNATSFLLTPPEWLQEAADAMSGRPEGSADVPGQRPAAEPGGGAPDASAPVSASSAASAPPAPSTPSTPSASPAPSAASAALPPEDDWPSAGGPGAGPGVSAPRISGEDDWPSDGGARSAAPGAPHSTPGAPPVPGPPAAPGPVPSGPVPGAPVPGGPVSGGPVPGAPQGRGGAVDDWPSDGVARPLAAGSQQDARSGSGAPSGDEGRQGAPPPSGGAGPGGASPWAPPVPDAGTPSSGSQAGNAAKPGDSTPWAGTDIKGDDDRSVAPPATVFAPPLAGSDDEDTPPPGVRPDAKTELMSGGSSLPPTAIASSLDFPAQRGGPGAGPGAGANPGDIADAATRKAGGGAMPPPPGAPGARMIV